MCPMSRGRRLSDAQKERMVTLFRYGSLTQREIAERFRVDVSTVSCALKAAGLGRKRRRWTPEEDAILYERYRTDGPRRLSAELGRSYGSICHHASELGLCGSCEIGPYGKRRKIKEVTDG